ncbi:adenylate/guanylate cyclase domain-containing protein [Tenacibaculum sp. 190524A05c]|uniref:Adenylate/guanylate cyclase domain-containing protein n=1 Tax=Tenacibaculum platacis TaxID=3137852 RepID=A0ABM9P1Z8_9FLAO
MSTNNKQFFKFILQSILFWVVALFAFAIFRFYGIEQESLLPTAENTTNQEILNPYLVSLFLGLGLGLLYGIVDYLYERFFLKKVGLGVGLLLNTFLHFISTIFVFTFGLNLIAKIFSLSINLEIGWWLTYKRFWAAILYIILSSLVFSFLKIAKERFGTGVFVKMLLGRYKIPQEEERIFMFLDLKDSTTIAEKLGHNLYSQFIQDCFYDLNEVVLFYDAEIYQYVGDEVVLSWPYHKGLANNNCIGVFFAFELKRETRKEYYLKKYGVFPMFKAGIHGGSLMAAEVGFVKKELAYHGDVINTSARIQAECNKHNVSLLISENLLKNLKGKSVSSSNFLGSVLLKGKEKEVKIHSILYDV